MIFDCMETILYHKTQTIMERELLIEHLQLRIMTIQSTSFTNNDGHMHPFCIVVLVSI